MNTPDERKKREERDLIIFATALLTTEFAGVEAQVLSPDQVRAEKLNRVLFSVDDEPFTLALADAIFRPITILPDGREVLSRRSLLFQAALFFWAANERNEPVWLAAYERTLAELRAEPISLGCVGTVVNPGEAA